MFTNENVKYIKMLCHLTFLIIGYINDWNRFFIFLLNLINYLSQQRNYLNIFIQLKMVIVIKFLIELALPLSLNEHAHIFAIYIWSDKYKRNNWNEK